MKLENKKLHLPPEPWYSQDKNLFKGVLIVNVIFWIIAIFIYFYVKIYMDSLYWGLNMITAMMLGLGAMIMYHAYQKSTDQEATWWLRLPYNKLLFELLAQKILVILQDGEYDYKANELINFHYVESDQETLESFARSYSIKSKHGQDLLLEFGLTKHRINESSYYDFIMSMEHIQMENLSMASSFAYDVKKLFKEIEFHKFKRVIREPEL